MPCCCNGNGPNLHYYILHLIKCNLCASSELLGGNVKLLNDNFTVDNKWIRQVWTNVTKRFRPCRSAVHSGEDRTFAVSTTETFYSKVVWLHVTVALKMRSWFSTKLWRKWCLKIGVKWMSEVNIPHCQAKWTSFVVMVVWGSCCFQTFAQYLTCPTVSNEPASDHSALELYLFLCSHNCCLHMHCLMEKDNVIFSSGHSYIFAQEHIDCMCYIS